MFITAYTNKILPKLGYMAYSINGFSGYSASDYKIDFKNINFMSILLIILGIIIIVKNYKNNH